MIIIKLYKNNIKKTLQIVLISDHNKSISNKNVVIQGRCLYHNIVVR